MSPSVPSRYGNRPLVAGGGTVYTAGGSHEAAAETAMRVFISYSHDSPEHDARVLDLSNRLRTESGIECRIDQYEVSPPEGWPKWMVRQVAESDFVLVVCTETYLKRVEGKESSGRGLGVRWESTLIYQVLYDAGAENTKFVPVVFCENDLRFIPTPLRGATRINMGESDGYQRLVRRLYNIPPAAAPPVGTPLQALPARPEFFRPPANNFLQAGVARNLDFVGREKQIQELYEALSRHNVAVNQAVAGEGGIGKSQLATEFAFRFAGDFDGVWWLDASEAAIDAGTSALADAMGIRAARYAAGSASPGHLSAAFVGQAPAGARQPGKTRTAARVPGAGPVARAGHHSADRPAHRPDRDAIARCPHVGRSC